MIGRNHPVDLLELVFRPADPKLRFEAIRKLFHMTRMAAIDFRSVEQEEEEDFNRINNLLDQRFWSGPRGHTTDVNFLSIHSLEGYTLMTQQDLDEIDPALQPVTEVPADEIASARKRVLEQDPESQGYYLRLTPLQSRTFVHRGREIHAFFDPRKKSLESRANKMLRKREDDPSVAVEDRLGTMTVVRDERDVDAFLDHLIDMAISAGIILRSEGLEDSLGGRRYSARNVGSSPRTQMLKHYLRTLGTRIEDVVFPIKDYLNYEFDDEIGHPELEVRRFFDTGLYVINFPQTIYPEVNPVEDREYLLKALHDAKRIPANSIG